VALREQVTSEYPDYHAAPVPAWGRKSARLLIVGLAPGMHGANKTGRPFTGDSSGEFLFRALHRAGFSSSKNAASSRLDEVRITNAVKCLPPGNRPSTVELNNCRDFLMTELHELTGRRPRRDRVIFCLGGLAHDAVTKALALDRTRFQHGQQLQLDNQPVWLVDSYHPSRLNTNTGRLTEAMFDGVFQQINALLGR
jgi:uracil-DNA glycosylase family 4